MGAIVITGSTRGIGYGLAQAFLERGQSVVVSSRTDADVKRAVLRLGQTHDATRVRGVVCDVTRMDDLNALWTASVEAFGAVDVWINNAGTCPPTKSYMDLHSDEITAAVDTNVRGTMLASHVALTGMAAQGYGQLFSMEGWGSRGEWSSGMTVYAATKRALRHFSDGLARESRDTGVRIGTLGPGMVATDLLVDAWTSGAPANWRRMKRLFHFVIDPPDPVCTYLAGKVLANRRTNVHYRWMNPLRLGVRFFQPHYWRRNPLAGTRLDTFGD